MADRMAVHGCLANGSRSTKGKGPEQFVRKEVGGEKNGYTRLVRIKKLPRYYPTVSKLKKPRTYKRSFYKPRRYLRTPGTVVIIVAGKHHGKRVVFLKQLESGLLLVTGPFKLNRCPLRRINQSFVIATRTKLDISGINIPGHLNDAYFKRKRPKHAKKDEGDIFETKKETYKASPERKKDQIEVDKLLLDIIRKHPEKKYVFSYLGAMFSLRNNQFPHRIIF